MRPSDDEDDTGAGAGDTAATAATAATADHRAPRRRADHTPPTADPDDRGEVAPPLAAGTRLGRYVVDAPLARGGMGVVYRATDPVLDRRVAVKLIRVRTGHGGERARARLLREAQALARLSHPNVIAVHDAGTTDAGEVFVAMELVPGRTLGAWRRGGARALRAILDVLTAAGRGLAAAHAAGIAHRDFKPDNVLVGDDGRVRVIDFGLARALDSDSVDDADPGARDAGARDADAETDPGRPDRALASGDRLRTPLTVAGAIMGTPAFMSPEQHRTGGGDAPGDQYAFCVTAWETLYGVLPFTALPLDDLLADKEAGRLAPTPPRARIPARVRRVLLRGLSPRPADRYPSMHALLAALTHAAGAPRRRATIAASATLAVGAVAAAVWWPGGGAADPCAAAGDRLAGAWDADVAAAITVAFGATGRPHGAATAARVASALDAYAGAWTAMRVDSCQATHVRHEQSAELLDLRTACLDRRRDELAALTALLARAADGEVVDHAVEAALGLPAVTRCADVDALRGQLPLPDEPEVRARIVAVRARIAEAGALAATAQYPAAWAIAEPALAEARAVAFPPAVAEALVTVADLHDRLARADAAVAAFQEAARVAAAARDDHVAARALVDLVWIVGYKQTQPEVALAMAPGADAAVTRAGDPAALRARLASGVGLSEILVGRYADAERTTREAIARHERAGAGDDLAMAGLHSVLGQVLLSVGNAGEARVAFARALAIRERLQGADHPDTSVIRSNLAILALREGDFATGLAELERALAIDEANYGPDHPQVALSLLNLGASLHDQGRSADALPYLERAAAIQRRALGPDHRELAMTVYNLGAARVQLGDPAAAIPHFEEAVGIIERAQSPTHPDLAYPLRGVADAQLAAGRPADALASFRRALVLQENAGAADTAEGAHAWVGIGDALLALGRAREAEDALRRGVALYDAIDGLPVDEARARFLLGRAVWGVGRDRARARAFVVEARAGLAGRDDAADVALRAELDAWLAAHP